MHAVMMESLEEYLTGSLEPAALRDVEAHLSTCRACREELQSIREVSEMFGSLRPDRAEVWNAGPGFYARVVQQAGQRASASFASYFGLDLAFGRRLAFASLLMFAILGGYLVSHESDVPVGPSPEAILAQQNAPGFETASAENNMLVTLTAYEH